MRGAIVLSTDQGLGYLAKDLYDHKIIEKVLIKPHSTRTNNTWWYQNEDWKWLQKENYEWFFKDLSSILYIEEPFDWQLIPEARKRGIKNVLMPMYECTRQPFPYEFDLLLAPSYLDFTFYKDKSPMYLAPPVERKLNRRKVAKVFVHNAGNGGLGGRNGTKELLEAMKYVKSPIKLIVRSKEKTFKSDDPRVEIRIGNFPRETLYDEGDIFIFPEKFNGLSLPLREAFASGMGIMCGDRYPMNKCFPKELLIPVKGYKKERIAVEFDSAIIDPKDIALTIDKWYGKDISKYTVSNDWLHDNSWGHLTPIYLNNL